MAWCELIERERTRVMAQDFINLRNAQADTEPASKYHNDMLTYAAGKAIR
jgi:hypothetical protein